MDELSVVLKARGFVNEVNPTGFRFPVKAYVDHIQDTLKVDHSLGPDEDGWSAMKPNGKYGICVNGNQSGERQRFTVCHELAHIILGLPSEHGSGPSWSYAKRSPNEILCDVFAAELLLPYKLFKPLVDKSEYSLAAIDVLADQFEASTMATGSRFASMARWPCAFVLSEQGKVRYSARSRALRDAKTGFPHGWICRKARSRSVGAQVTREPVPRRSKPTSGSRTGIGKDRCSRTPVTSAGGTRRWPCSGSRTMTFRP
jgi:Zn-dependent peptidase ImmA (M78 family)